MLLTTDIDFTGKSVAPVGKNWGNGFLGVFDGQGHTISNLKTISSLEFVGLFGLSKGLTIKNVVVDDTCSFSSTASTPGNIGGIIGRVTSEKGVCSILNSVNMTNVTCMGNSNGNKWMGGITGIFHSTRYTITVANCVNYGTVASYGTTTRAVYIGGIIGECYGNYTYNCANYGTLIQNGTGTAIYVGGITSASWKTAIRNCMSA